jgi:hypothetical protein
MGGNCFLLAVRYLQKDICHILVTLYGFGIVVKNFNHFVSYSRNFFTFLFALIDPREKCDTEDRNYLHWLLLTDLNKFYDQVKKKSL